MTEWEKLQEERARRLHEERGLFHKLWLWWTAPIIRGWVVVLYVGFFGALAIGFNHSTSTDDAILRAQLNGRMEACRLARLDNAEDKENVQLKKDQLARTIKFIRENPNAELTPALIANLPNTRAEVEQAKTGIDPVPRFCNDPNLGIPES